MEIGTILSIVALLLAFPLSLLANLLTPNIKNWWAQRSIKTLQRRIQKLEGDLAKINEDVHMEDFFDSLRSLFKILALIAYSLFCILGGMFIIFIFPDLKFATVPYFLYGIVLSVIAFIWSMEAFGLTNKKVNPSYKAKLGKQIDSLKAKLESKLVVDKSY